MAENIKVSAEFKTSTKKLFDAWLNSEEHSKFTGSSAKINPKVGGKFSAWDGYISGKTLEIEPNKRILQTWRATDFPENSPDSLLEVLFEEKAGKTKLTLVHSKIPEGQSKEYEKGWKEFYFQPMKKYFK